MDPIKTEAKEPTAGEAAKMPTEDTAGQARDGYAKKLEDKGDLTFRVVWNDGSPQNMIDLIHLKNIFSIQLPKMPKEYIVRLVLDRKHRSMCIVKKGKVIGGICFRPFDGPAFGEIVFCAITATEQVKGYGTRLMNHLKEHVKTLNLEYFLTYADNYAIGYFKKQGFTKQVSMPRERWGGCIKDYDGGTLMECRINNKVNYLDLAGMIRRQREAVYEKIKRISNSHAVYPGLKIFEGRDPNLPPPLTVEQIPGVVEAGYQPPKDRRPPAIIWPPSLVHLSEPQKEELLALHARMGAVLKSIKALKDAWPFLHPVNGKLVPDYYEIIKQPMDLETMEKKLNRHEYASKEEFVRDVSLIVSNCRTYNLPTTTYYRCADSLERHFTNVGQHILDTGGVPETAVKDEDA